MLAYFNDRWNDITKSRKRRRSSSSSSSPPSHYILVLALANMTRVCLRPSSSHQQWISLHHFSRRFRVCVCLTLSLSLVNCCRHINFQHLISGGTVVVIDIINTTSRTAWNTLLNEMSKIFLANPQFLAVRKLRNRFTRSYDLLMFTVTLRCCYTACGDYSVLHGTKTPRFTVFSYSLLLLLLITNLGQLMTCFGITIISVW